MKKKSLIIYYILATSTVFSQGAYTSNNSEIERIIDRNEVLLSSDSALIFTGMKPFSRQQAASFMDKCIEMKDSTKLSSFDIEYSKKELSNWMIHPSTQDRKQPIFKYFYPREASFLEVNTKDFYLRVNPMLEIKLGKEKNNENSLYSNYRGLELTGTVARNLSFYVNFTENQNRYYSYINQYAQGFNGQNLYSFNPGFGYWKEFGTQGFDYSNSVGYVDFKVPKYFNFTLGHDRNFIGYGMRSLMLGDQSAPYFFLKSNLSVWKLNYQVLFTQFTGQYIRGGDQLLPKKFGAFHLLTFKPTKKIDIALFESVIFNRNDGFDFNYLNPIIFYRSIEHQLGSPDNSFLGLQAKWNHNNAQIYTQLILDDLQVKELLKSSGWWANKYGMQLGGKLFNIAQIKNLDALAEFNYVRPFTYSQYSTTLDTLANFTHYNQPLAHPLGANFTEFMLKINYKPTYRMNIEFIYSLMHRGLDTGASLYGNDILSNTKLPAIATEFGTTQLQGVRNQIHYIALNTSYMLWHNIYVDLDILYRKSNCQVATFDNSSVGIQAGIRCNIKKRRLIF